jgi:hypothetical protein
VTIGSELVDAKYSYLDMGQIANLFDGNKETLVRTMEANPFVLELYFTNPHLINGIQATLGSMEAQITIRTTLSDGQVKEYQTVFNATPENLTTEIDLNETLNVKVLHLEILNLHAGEPANVHVSEIVLK